jgi:hypothetical protein
MSTFNAARASLMGQFHEKIEWGILPWLRKNKIPILVFGSLTKKISLYALGEYLSY